MADATILTGIGAFDPSRSATLPPGPAPLQNWGTIRKGRVSNVRAPGTIKELNSAWSMNTAPVIGRPTKKYW